jgi:hypothetical protein
MLIKVRSGRTSLPNGILTQVADVKLDNGETVIVPLANMEVLV